MLFHRGSALLDTFGPAVKRATDPTAAEAFDVDAIPALRALAAKHRLAGGLARALDPDIKRQPTAGAQAGSSVDAAAAEAPASDAEAHGCGEGGCGKGGCERGSCERGGHDEGEREQGGCGGGACGRGGCADKAGAADLRAAAAVAPAEEEPAALLERAQNELLRLVERLGLPRASRDYIDSLTIARPEGV